MKVRRLTEAGMEQFRQYLKQVKGDPSLPPPLWMLTEPSLSEPLGVELEIDLRNFESRLEAARFLDELFGEAELADLDRDAGLWSWLTLFYFEQICPLEKGKGKRKVKELTCYVPDVGNFQKYYRHMLLGPHTIYQAYKEHANEAVVLLQGPLHIMTDIIEQLASRQDRISNRAVVGAASRMYVDAETGEYKRGSRGSGPGSPRRLSDVISQLDLNYDLYGMQADELISLLPKEFQRFLNPKKKSRGAQESQTAE